MSDTPTTPTGKRLWSVTAKKWGAANRDDILAIEAEAKAQAIDGLADTVVAALDRYRESIGPDQHYTDQRAAMVDAIAYATVFVVRPAILAAIREQDG